MKKIFKFLLLSLSMILLSSCINSNKNDLTDLIQTPKQDSPIVEGTWEVVEIAGEISEDSSGKINIGDKLYINKNLVAINGSYAFPPSFSSKFVKLSDYLNNRGIQTRPEFKDRNVIVINASQGQLFSRDLIITDENNLFLIKDENLISLKKISDKVDSKVVDSYAKLASKERTTTETGEDIAEDLSLLLGVRERIDPESDKPLYKYYTYLIRVEPDDTIKYMKCENIFIKNQDEYWKVSSDINNFTDIYDEIKAYPIKLENNKDSDDVLQKYTFKDIDLNTRINFVSKDFISIDYTNKNNENPIRKYALMETDNIASKQYISLEEFTGEEQSDQIFREKVKEELKKAIPDANTEKIPFDNTNFGIIRNQGYWAFQSSIFAGKGDSFVQNFFNLDIAIGDSLLNPTNSIITRDQVYNINTQFKDYVVLANQRYIAIQTPDEILIHRIKDGLIEKSPVYAIATRMPATIISVDQYLGSNALDLEEAFNKYNLIIEK
ncbi:hypothetical protein [uncultured Anaerococcus sp.]|uniref:hypothetical protein n=1 Tax=uncultured Anaerococcus sp. TaxID=293428 RepID=UPI0025E2FF3E|nr:hypothetical protein [uncultured Anaerococcus sp.]